MTANELKPTVRYKFERVDVDNFSRKALYLEVKIDPVHDSFLKKFEALLTSKHSETGLEILKINPKFKGYYVAEGRFCMEIHTIDSVRPLVNLLKEEDAQLFHFSNATTLIGRQEFLDDCKELFGYCQRSK
ncbi:MAG: hypothetical protein JNL70_11790 [Saprospiraceae bacterium]|nr:hypothetical protein [Saprospiraceae bacterium]